MIVFLNEDRAYRRWVTHHRVGFLLDGRRQPPVSRLTLHRADCQEMKARAEKRGRHWTTGRRLKACSMDRNELEAWSIDESGAAPLACSTCHPMEERAARPAHLSRLGREVLEYILEAALIHMEHEHPPYRLTIGDIAACFAKTPAQLAPLLHDLNDQGMIVMPELSQPRLRKNASTATARRVVYPSIAALRTLEAFGDEPESALERELAKLRVG
jgi:hypothetical protein